MKRVFTLCLALMTVITLSVGCAGKAQPSPEKYTEYLCYDYHLASLKVENKRFLYQPEDGNYKQAWKIYFQKVKGESDDHFMYAKVLIWGLGSTPKKLIFQPPNNHVDVLNDWTIKKIELFYIDGRVPKKQSDKDKPSRTPTKVLASSSDAEILAEFAEFVTSNNSTATATPIDGYGREFYGFGDDDPQYRFYIRIHFNESNSIVWETEMESYRARELQDRVIVFDHGREMVGLSIIPETVAIDKDSALFAWLSESLDQLAD